jgi:hypothetical protein
MPGHGPSLPVTAKSFLARKVAKPNLTAGLRFPQSGVREMVQSTFHQELGAEIKSPRGIVTN